MKELRKSKKRYIANRKVKGTAKDLIKKSRKAMDGSASSASSSSSASSADRPADKSADAKGEAADLVKQACKALDKAAQKNVIKKGNAARRKSRLMRQLNTMKK